MAPQNKIETMPLILKIGGFMISLAVMVSSYFLNSTMNKMNEMDRRITAIEMNAATISGTKFTTTDWATQKAFIESDRNALDKRILKLEENSAVIKESLMEIKSILKEQK
jgi:uncharacterized protein YdcH (DUF465 family)